MCPDVPAARNNSNNVAEYLALIAILERQIEVGLTAAPILIHGDSNLVMQQMFGRWKIKQGRYVEHAKTLLASFTKASGLWIPRRRNAEADDLSKEALRGAGV